MIASDCMIFVRTLLDDSRDWFPTTTEIENAINQAQMEKIRQYYAMHDERALRPLYRETALSINGEVIIDPAGQSVLYPRSCKVFVDAAMPDKDAYAAQYKNNELFFNYSPPLYDAGQTFPRAAYYTVRKQYNAISLAWETTLWFTGGVNAVAKLWYISYPIPFQLFGVAVPVTLSVPQEYHVEILGLAAEIINDMDVGEMERGEPVFQNQRLTLKGVADIGG